MKAINKDKIIMAEIVEPYGNTEDNNLPFGEKSHGWQVRLTIGHSEHWPIYETVEATSEANAMRIIQDLGLIFLP